MSRSPNSCTEKGIVYGKPRLDKMNCSCQLKAKPALFEFTATYWLLNRILNASLNCDLSIPTHLHPRHVRCHSDLKLRRHSPTHTLVYFLFKCCSDQSKQRAASSISPPSPAMSRKTQRQDARRDAFGKPRPGADHRRLWTEAKARPGAARCGGVDQRLWPCLWLTALADLGLSVCVCVCVYIYIYTPIMTYTVVFLALCWKRGGSCLLYMCFLKGTHTVWHKWVLADEGMFSERTDEHVR